MKNPQSKNLNAPLLQVNVGQGAHHLIHNPASDQLWQLRYTPDIKDLLGCAGIIESFDYLLSDEISTTEAIRRLRLLRKARAESIENHENHKIAQELTDFVTRYNKEYSVRWNPNAVMLPIAESDNDTMCTRGAFEIVTKKTRVVYQRRTAKEIENLFKPEEKKEFIV